MIDSFGQEVTPEKWAQVDLEIKRFVRLYPLHWKLFQNDLRANRTKFQLGEGELKKSSFRNTLSFPVVARRRTQAEIEADPGHGEIEFGESLKETIEKIIPGFTAPDEGSDKNAKDIKPNKLYREFIRRYYSLFQPGEEY